MQKFRPDVFCNGFDCVLTCSSHPCAPSFSCRWRLSDVDHDLAPLRTRLARTPNRDAQIDAMRLRCEAPKEVVRGVAAMVNFDLRQYEEE